MRHGTASFEFDPPDEAEMARRQRALIDAGYPYLVAEIGGAVMGYAYAGPYRTRPAYRYTVENSIYIAPDAQRRGIGRALIDRLIAECEQRGYRLMIAVIGDSAQTPSIELHRAAGFTAGRHVRGGRLQVRSLARLGADAAPARQGRRRHRPDYVVTSFSDLSTARSTLSSSCPRLTIRPVAEITL